MAVYDVGDVVTLSATFRDEDGALADPTIVTLLVETPSGDVNEVTASSASTGLYSTDVLITESGVWRMRWESSGNPTAAEEGRFYVRPQRVVEGSQVPFKSKAQARFMFANHPKVAKRWAAETNSIKKLPKKKRGKGK